MMMEISRTRNTNDDFSSLTRALDSELNERYGSQQADYEVHNVIDLIETAMVGYVNKTPVACGCFREIDETKVEIKRMYVKKGFRRRGFSKVVLSSLEEWAAELGKVKILLETGKGQTEAIGLYERFGYRIIENYGPYQGMENSVCMMKTL
jgi:putative acetyltransferase